MAHFETAALAQARSQISLQTIFQIRHFGLNVILMKNLKIKHAQNKNFTDKIEIIMYQEETLVFYKFWIARKILEFVFYFIQENFVPFRKLAAL